jgi:hypothetical protein
MPAVVLGLALLAVTAGCGGQAADGPDRRQPPAAAARHAGFGELWQRGASEPRIAAAAAAEHGERERFVGAAAPAGGPMRTEAFTRAGIGI